MIASPGQPATLDEAAMRRAIDAARMWRREQLRCARAYGLSAGRFDHKLNEHADHPLVIEFWRVWYRPADARDERMHEIALTSEDEKAAIGAYNALIKSGNGAWRVAEDVDDEPTQAEFDLQAGV